MRPAVAAAALWAGILLLAPLSGCGPYAITLNGHTLYTPPALFSDFAVADAHLSECIKKTIAEQQITTVDALTHLRCPQLQISSTQGLAQLNALKILDLAGNRLHTLEDILNLTQLEQVNLNDNPQLNCVEVPKLINKGIKVLAKQCGL